MRLDTPSHARQGGYAGILTVILVYASFAGLWILLSDKVVAWLMDVPAQVTFVSTAKGWLFVAVTSLLLYGLMRRLPLASVHAAPEAKPSSPLRHALLLPFALLAAAIVILTLSGVAIDFHQQKESEAAQLKIIAELKTRQIADWLDERRSDARFLRNGRFSRDLDRRWLSGEAFSGDDKLLGYLQAFARNNAFQGVLLLSPGGEALWSSDGIKPVLDPRLVGAVRQAAADQHERLDGPYRDDLGRIHLDFILPLPARNGEAGVVIVLHADPAASLYPLLQAWPLATATGEAVLFRRDGDQIFFPSDPSHPSGTAQSPRLQLAAEHLLTARFLQDPGKLGQVLNGVDARGEPVMGVAMAVPATDWFLLVKLDLAELDGKAASSAAWIGFAGLLALFMTAAGAFLLRQRQQLSERKQSSEELDRYRQHLEELVEVRTKDLRLRTRSLRALIDNIPHLIWSKDREGRFLAANRALAEAVGCAIPDMLGKTNFELWPQEMAESFQEDDAEVVRSRLKMTVEERIPNQRGRLFETFKAPILDADGSLLGTVGFSRDISAQKEMEREREAAREAAEAANRAKSAFLANMSHEIRTPMNAIVGLAYLMQRSAPSPAQAARLSKIESAANHLLSIVNDVLDLSKIEAGRLELERTDFQLMGVLDHVRSLIADQAKSKGLRIALETDEMPPWLRGDPTRLRQALLNYAGNAVKFTEHGTITLGTRLLEERDGDLLVRFSVSDTGIGIAARELPLLFAPFGQADVSTTRKHGGTGLGLVITRRLAQLMGGDAGVESEPGRGSTFWFTARLARGLGDIPDAPCLPMRFAEAG